MSTRLLFACAGTVAALSCPALASDFRVNPYLQNPTTNAVTINWFTTAAATGSISVEGPGLAAPLVVSSTPAIMPALAYDLPGEDNPVAATNDQRVLAGGVPAANFKHSVRITGLVPASTYTYTVTQGGTTFTRTFRTSPEAQTTQPLRFAVLSDSETLVSGRTRFREWAAGAQAPGSSGRPSGTGRGRSTYLLTERDGYAQNIALIDSRDPDLIIMPGDLIEGTTAEHQRRWDEFWRHNAGEFDDLLSKRALVAAIGNNCIFLGSGAGVQGTNERIRRARQQWSAYFDFPSIPDGEYQDLYHRTDFGPVTILTLCSVKAVEEANHMVAPVPGIASSDTVPARANRDTNRAWFNVLYPFGDIPDFNTGTRQWNWAVEQLAAARAENRIIFVQWHHTPWSRGIHGSSVTSNQSGEAMRIYVPLMEQYNVAGVFCGHSEVAERSFIDTNADGRGINLWDVGYAGDGLRGIEDAPGSTTAPITAWRNTEPGFVMNPYSQWTADRSEPELWRGNTLLAGGKHYGHLDVQILPHTGGRYTLVFQPWHVFPINAGDTDFSVTGFEPRRYDDRVILRGTPGQLERITACSIADVTGPEIAGYPDGTLDGSDFIAFINSFAVGDAAVDAIADIAGGGTFGQLPDGTIDGSDFITFINGFASGC
jgi:3',5'-cyclic AMP phosphodiesterase CpdA